MPIRHPRLLVGSALAALAASLTLTVPSGSAQEAPTLVNTGYILGGAKDALVERNAHALSTLGVAAVAISGNGKDVATPTADTIRLVTTAHDNGLRAELLVSNYRDAVGGFDSRAARRLLRNQENIDAVAAKLAGFAVDQGWDGITVDLESLAEGDGPGLVMLVEELQSRMPEEKTVSIDLQASTDLDSYRKGGYRLEQIAEVADVVALMTYDLHGPTWSRPGAIGPLAWQRRAIETLVSVVPREKVDLGVAGYGYRWPKRGEGGSVTVNGARRMVRKDGANAVWKAKAGEWTARLSNGTVLWWSDGRSYEKRLQLAQELGVHGVALWRLGSTDTL
jgi:spore germination protein